MDAVPDGRRTGAARHRRVRPRHRRHSQRRGPRPADHPAGPRTPAARPERHLRPGRGRLLRPVHRRLPHLRPRPPARRGRERPARRRDDRHHRRRDRLLGDAQPPAARPPAQRLPRDPARPRAAQAADVRPLRGEPPGPARGAGRQRDAQRPDRAGAHLRLAEAQSRWRPTYVYQFDWHVPYASGLPAAQNLGAMHTLELPFVFGTLVLDAYPRGPQTVAGQRPALTAMSGRMMDAWTSFARAADPGWPRYTADGRATRIWDLEPTVRHAPREDERELWDAYDFPAWDGRP
ncbi:carboxylesterase family protein [Kitasatospora sp. NPDC051170]|uniref:carboxylesterase family protein n=1 Tax=Kitasatospora sp. NPDC051170 TaxID=3364056 RepID=UPI0037AD77F1